MEVALLYRAAYTLRLFGKIPKCIPRVGFVGGASTVSSISMSESSRLLAAVHSCLPTLSYEAHKGEAGRVAVVGGSKEYSGAPYFAAISALKLGADVTHIFCKEEAGVAIKSYSPELIVHPTLDSSHFIDDFTRWLPRLHAVVLGPGLGRDEYFRNTFKEIVTQLVDVDIPVVIDADGLYYLSTTDGLLNVIHGKKHIMLTPNVNEMSLLYKSLDIDHKAGVDPQKDSEYVAAMCIKLGYVTVVHKGASDIISNGEHILVCGVNGSPRRCGGQGDLLSGTMGLLTFWAKTAIQNKASSNAHLLRYGANMCGAYGACALTRQCNNLAYAQLGRSTTTTDMISMIHKSTKVLFASEG